MKTCATPGSVDTRCPILISTYSFMTGSGRVADRRVKSKTGGSLGFALRYTGGVVISAGNLREALAIAAWMSWAAASIFRLRLNCTVIRPTPSPLTEVIESTPAIAANSRSSGEAIEAATFPDAFADVAIISAVLHFARDDGHFAAMLQGAWRVLKPGGILFCRLASSIGMESQVRRIAGRRFLLPDGSERYLVDEDLLLHLTGQLGGRLLDPLKTTVVQNQRSMTTWVVRRDL